MLLISTFALNANPSKELSKAEAKALKSEIEAMFADFESGETKTLLAKTHPSIFALIGDQAAFEKMTNQAMKQILAMGITFVSSELGTPTKLHKAGDEEVCFVPRVSVMKMQGMTMKSTGYMIAIRDAKGGAWKYLDGAGLRKKPKMLSALLPELATDIKLPTNTIEVLEVQAQE